MEEKKKSNSGLICLVIFLLVLVLGLAGYICYDKFYSKKEPVKTDEKGKEEPKEKEKLLTGKTVDDYKEDSCFTTNEESSFIKEDGNCGPLYKMSIFTSDGQEIVSKIDYYLYSIKEEHLYAYKDGKLLVINKNAEIEKNVEKGNVIHIMDNYAAILDNNKVSLYDIDNDKTIELGTVDADYEYSSLGSHYYDKEETYGDYKPGYYLIFVNHKLPDDAFEKDENGQPLNAYEYYYIPETGETGKIKTFLGGLAKPILYLYPTEDNTNITVSFAKPNLLTTTYPKFNNAWKVTANKNGDLYDAKGNYYYGLYWEEDGAIKVDFSEGFYVTKDNAINFLEDKLTTIGLNAKERNEFIMYWLPILEKNEKNLVYFELTESREANNKLIINPQPDSLLRIAIHIKKVDKKVDIKEQKLPTFNRTGFVAVEWGGTIH